MSRISTPPLSRRDWLKLSAAGVVSYSLSGWLEAFAADAAPNPQRRRSCIVLWMNGGPSQIDTFDPKPDAPENIRGQFKSIATSVPGIQISEHLPKIAKQMKRLAIVRSMSTKEADHTRGTYLLHTGRAPGSPVLYPAFGSLVAKEIGGTNTELPSFVSIAPFRFFSPGGLRARLPRAAVCPTRRRRDRRWTSPSAAVRPPTMRNPSRSRTSTCRPASMTARPGPGCNWSTTLKRTSSPSASGPASLSHYTAYQRAVTMMRSEAVKAFNLDGEAKELRDRYGRNLFGQGCLLARRLIERGVPFVEVTLNNAPGVNNGIGWDTHQRNFETVKALSGILDAGWSTLMDDLKARGLLDSTLIVWMGEFGRTPKINGPEWPRPLGQLLEHGAGRRRHQGRTGHRQDQQGRQQCRGPARLGQRLPGHRRRRSGHRHHQAKPVQRRPAYPYRRASAKPIEGVLA